MDKYEYTAKTEKIKKLAEKKDYVGAAKVADGIDWSRVQDVRMLTLAADIYERNRRYADAKEVLIQAYELVPVGRRMLYRLTELSIKEGNLEEAADFFEEFRKVAPGDAGQYILCYQMAVVQGETIDKQIALLEAYRKREFEEKWAYELARLYAKAGKKEACVRLCDEIVLWFGFGKYVEKAMQLKQNFASLTPAQAEKMRQMKTQEPRVEAPVRAEEPAAVLEEAVSAREAAATRAGRMAPERQEARRRPEPQTGRMREEEVQRRLEEEARAEEVRAEAARKAKEEEERQELRRIREEERAREVEQAQAAAAVSEAAPVRRAERVSREVPGQRRVRVRRAEAAEVRRQTVNDETVTDERDWGRPRYVQPEDPAEKERQQKRQLEAMLQSAVLTAAQFDADGFALDLPGRMEPAAPVGETQIPKAPLQEEILPKIDLECVREAVEEKSETFARPAGYQEEKTEIPVRPEVRQSVKAESAPDKSTQMNLEDALREMGMASGGDVRTSLAEELRFVAETWKETQTPEEPAAERPVSARQAEVQQEEVRRAKPQTAVPSEEVIDAEVSKLSALLMESFQEPEPEAAPAGQSAVPEQDADSQAAAAQAEPAAQPELELETTIFEEDGEGYAPIFTCLLMEAADLTQAIAQAVDLIKETHSRLGTQASQAAKISGTRLNKKGVKNSLERLNGRDLIVEGAGALNRELLLELADVLRYPVVDGVVVLTDEPDELRKLVKTCPELAELTEYVEEEAPAQPVAVREQVDQVQKDLETKRRAEEELNRLMEERSRAEAEAEQAAAEKQQTEEDPWAAIAKVERPAAALGETALTTKAFVECVKDYAQEMECVLAPKAEEAILARAEEMLEEGEKLTEDGAKELADDAIYLAERPSIKGLFVGKYDKNGYLILKEQHFSEC